MSTLVKIPCGGGYVKEMKEIVQIYELVWYSQGIYIVNLATFYLMGLLVCGLS